MKLSVRGSIHRLVLGISAAVSIGVLFTQFAAHADPTPEGWQASNMKAIGYSGLAGRGGAFKMAIRQVAGRWHPYMGHEWHRRWSILDVTAPTHPKYVRCVDKPYNPHT